MDDWEAIPLSRLAHAGYCLRRAALLTNEQLWNENADTAKGREAHKRVHTSRIERRGDHLQLFEYDVFSKDVLMRYARTASNAENADALYAAAEKLSGMAKMLSETDDVNVMRGIEGAAANAYFSVFDNMIDGKNGFVFDTRSKRPPRNEVNAVLSFVYTLMTHDCISALETVGLDPAAGYLHTLRPGRASFALDLIEELRAPLCDRFVISLLHKGQLSKKDFNIEGDAIWLSEKGRRTVLTAWRERKREEITHPFFKEKISIGLIPYTQAMLFARVLRGDLDLYPPFVWR